MLVLLNNEESQACFLLISLIKNMNLSQIEGLIDYANYLNQKNQHKEITRVQTVSQLRTVAPVQLVTYCNQLKPASTAANEDIE